MKINHYIGSILLVAGTTIGVGMLGLPVTTSFMGFFPSILLLILCWSFMLMTAFFFIDVNGSMKGETNLITMAEKTLGAWGRMLAWVVYLVLLYSLMAAYIAASAPLFMKGFESFFGILLPQWLANFCLPLFFGFFIYLGTTGVDLINRIFMFGLLLAYLLLIVGIPAHIEPALLTHTSWPPFLYAAPIVLTAFGYHIIIPTLATYMNHDRKALFQIVVIGSSIALIFNIIWQFLVLGAVPLKDLAFAWNQGLPATGPLAAVIQAPWLASAAYLFAFFAIITSFLGVALSLADFLTDGLKIKKSWEGRLIAMGLTFLPPLIFVYSYQRGFIIALEYAGAAVAILLLFLPAAMAWKLRTPAGYRTPRGRLLLSLTMLFALLIVLINITIQWGLFAPFLTSN